MIQARVESFGVIMPQKFQNLINGKWLDAKSGRTFENRNPARWDELIAIFPKSSKEDVDDAVKAARAAFEKWRLVPAPKRGDIMRKVGDLMVARKEDLAHEMTREMGKIFHVGIAIGKFQGVMMPATPTGTRIAIANLFGSSDGTV